VLLIDTLQNIVAGKELENRGIILFTLNSYKINHSRSSGVGSELYLLCDSG